MRLARCGLAATVLVMGACGGAAIDRHPDASGLAGFGGGFGGAGGSGAARVFVQDVSRNVDILFLIDDSSEVRLQQNKLRADFPMFVSTLQSLPGGMPNVHIGVISSDMGAGDGSISGCNATGGDNGILQYTGKVAPPSTTPCTTNLQAGATFISYVGGVGNYTGTLVDTFKCIAALGESGCGFEHYFASLLRALGADGLGAPPAENDGFLRSEAALAVIMLTNEDDCSASPGVPLFDTRQNTTLTSQLGPPGNFRCNEFGHICGGGHPVRMAPNGDVNATVAYDDCTSNDGEGYELGVVDTANRIKALKEDPSRIAVATIQGPAAPYVVKWHAPSTTDRSCGAASCPWPAISDSCTGSDGTFASPGVRVQELAAQFGANGLVLPACADTYGPSLQQAARLIGQLFLPPCIPGPIADDPNKAGVQPNCLVTADVRQSNGASIVRTIPTCADGAPPCWTAMRAQPNCGSGMTVQLTPDPLAPSSIGSLSIKCFECAGGSGDPSCY